MFPHGYFAGGFFAPGYFPPVIAVTSPAMSYPGPTSRKRLKNQTVSLITHKDLRKERKRKQREEEEAILFWLLVDESQDE